MTPADRDTRPSLIVGAGIAGLACALALSKAGFRSILCERSDRLEPVGAGLQLSANALSVLDRLGVLPALRQTAFAARTVALRDGASDRLLARVPVESGADGYLAAHRADLQTVLLDAVRGESGIELRLGRSLAAIDRRSGGVRAHFTASDGRTEIVEAPLLIGADGVHSATAALLSCRSPADSGLVAHRFALTRSPGTEIEAWLSPRSHAVSYPMRGSGERNLVLVEPQGRDVLPEASDWNPRLSGFLRQGAYLGRWPLLTVEPDERLRAFGRAVLIGDAAHAMFPFAAQGAAMALEDAWVLAGALALQPDVDRAIARYVELRRPRIDQVLKRVRFHRFVYHLGWPANLARNAAMRLRPERAMRRDLAWLYDWRAEPLARPLVART